MSDVAKMKFLPSQLERFLVSVSGFRGSSVEYVDDGVSTEVYKVIKKGQVYYLRIIDDDETASPEVLAHELILKKGVSAPRVACWKDFDKKLKGRSWMIKEEIPGGPLKGKSEKERRVIYAAGRDLALINSINSDGFGWIRRDKESANKLIGCYPSFEEFIFDMRRIENMLRDLVKLGILEKSLVKKYLKYVAGRKSLVICPEGHLSHGDFDLSHIFVKESEYTGIIDFGDIRLTSVYHDLAHFYTFAPKYFQDLLKGYLSVTRLDNGYMEKIDLIAVLFALGKLWWRAKNMPKKVKAGEPALEKVLSVKRFG